MTLTLIDRCRIEDEHTIEIHEDQENPVYYVGVSGIIRVPVLPLTVHVDSFTNGEDPI